DHPRRLERHGPHRPRGGGQGRGRRGRRRGHRPPDDRSVRRGDARRVGQEDRPLRHRAGGAQDVRIRRRAGGDDLRARDGMARGADRARVRLRYAVPLHARARVHAERGSHRGRAEARPGVVAMATFDFRLPDIGEGVVEGEVVKWKVAEGEQIKLDQPMVEVMTDKATVEIPAPRGGRVAKIHVPEGKICQVGQVMISIEESGKAVEPSGNGKAKAATAAAVPLAAAVPVAVAATAAVAAANAAPAPRVLATPATRRLEGELGIDLASGIASGGNNRVTSDDVRRAREAPPARAAAAPAVAPVRIEAGGAEERVPFRGVRKAIAANLARSKQTAAHFTYVEEVDVTDLVALRARAKDKVAERGAKLTYLPFIVKAAVAGLKKWPSLNSSLDETTQEIVLKKYYHLSIATQWPQRLSVR